MTVLSERVGMLDADEVNGPRDVLVDWDAVTWSRAEENVRRLRQRIFAAEQAGDTARVVNLQKLMLRSWSNTLVSVRRVTQRNAGRATAGVDGQVALTSPERADLAVAIHGESVRDARPVKRVYIPKGNGKQRPLGIPVLADRVHQARVVNALEPQWEARFEPRSYGFRPGRGCHDAIEAIYWTLKGRLSKRSWVLDADLSAAFDRIDHARLLDHLGGFPAREAIAGWLSAGVIERGRFSPTDAGTPQGGVIGPLLLNIALHGMEEAAGVRYRRCHAHGVETVAGSPVLVRYADDFVVMCHTRDQAEQVWNRLEQWLTPRGLTFNTDKTRLVRVEDGFDFLGFAVRRHAGKLLITPSRAAVTRFMNRLTQEVRSLRGFNAVSVIRRLTPIIRGWAAYYRSVVASRAFAQVDHHLWRCLYRWALRAHPNKSRRWVVARYFDAFNPSRRDQWVFGDRDSGLYLHRLAWTRIVRHTLVMGTASVDDPSLGVYWATRRQRTFAGRGRVYGRMLIIQHGRCPACGDLLQHADDEPQTPHEWEQWLTTIAKAAARQAVTTVAGPNDPATSSLIHTHCRQRWAQQPRISRPPTGLA